MDGYAFITFSTWLANESGGRAKAFIFSPSDLFFFFTTFSILAQSVGMWDQPHLYTLVSPWGHCTVTQAVHQLTGSEIKRRERENEGLTERRLCGLVPYCQDLTDSQTCRKAVSLLASYPWAAARCQNRVTAVFGERSLTGKTLGQEPREEKQNSKTYYTSTKDNGLRALTRLESHKTQFCPEIFTQIHTFTLPGNPTYD